MTFEDATALYTLHLRALRRSAKTLEWYAQQFSAWENWRIENGVAPTLPTAETVEAFIACQHASGWKPSTVHARYRGLRAVFNFLEKRRVIDHHDNPFHRLEAPTVPKELRNAVTLAEFERLEGSISAGDWVAWRDRCIVFLLFFSGLRVAELCDLCVGDIRLTPGVVVAVRRGKGCKGRAVPGHPELRRLLPNYLFARPAHPAELFLRSDGWQGSTGLLQPEGVRQMLIRRCRKAGIAYHSPHAFRHGFAMWGLNAGMPLTTVSRMMGHADVSTTSAIYAHATLATIKEEYAAALRRSQGG